MWKYIRYSLLSVVGLISLATLLASGPMMWTGFVLTVGLALGGDQLLGDDMSEPGYRHPYLLDGALYLNLPILIALTIAFAWQLHPGDLMGLGQALSQVTGVDLLARKAQDAPIHLLGAGLGVGLLYGVCGTNVAHELTHRTWSRPAQWVGRWLLAFTCDASFSIEHVYGHHKHVATRQDPATSRRGESAWAFVVRSTWQSWRSAWRIEARRLAKQGHRAWSWRNKVITGAGMTAAIFAFFGWALGPIGLLVFAALSLYGKMWLELINYVEHYGIVRVKGAPVEPRHSWNCNQRMSSYMLYNLTRHSHHHAMGEKPFWQLRAYADTPTMPLGYMGMIVLALVPPLWNRVMIPRVLAWDAQFASDDEAGLITQANALSGHPWFTEGLPRHIALPPITSATPPSPRSEADQAVVPINLAQAAAGLLSGKRARTVSFQQPGSAPSGSTLELRGGETILQAALDQGMAFPHNCRVGGCASCKCRLVQGRVKALTDASYILSAQELAQGYILACQSVPREDVIVEVPGFHPSERSLVYKSGAQVVALEPLNHDIVRLRLRLDGPIHYLAGQYARLSVPGQIVAPRSYSFAAAPRHGETTREVEFHVRLVPGGQMSTWLHTRAAPGDRMHLEGPFGQTTLAALPSPVLCIAGGSGLAPIYALLEQAVQDTSGPVTLLFGARTQDDLYFAQELEQLERKFDGRLTVRALLSGEPQGSKWRGERGLVTDAIPADFAGRAYLCGPPAMVEAAKRALTHLPSDHVRADAFYDRRAAASPEAGAA